MFLRQTSLNLTFFFAVIRSQSQVIFKSMFFDKIFCFVWLSNLMGDDQDSLNKFIDTICLKIKDTKFFDSKILLEHVTIKLRLDLFRFKNVKLSAVKARSCLIPILRQFPSNPVLLQSLFTKTEFRPSVADQFWRESVKVMNVWLLFVNWGIGIRDELVLDCQYHSIQRNQ